MSKRTFDLISGQEPPPTAPSVAAAMQTSCPHLARVRKPSASQIVYREECTQCFDSEDSDTGVDVCLTCFNGGCRSHLSHAALHSQKFDHPIVLNIRRTIAESGNEQPAKITKLAIGLPGGLNAEEPQYKFAYRVCCYACGGLELDTRSADLPAVIETVMKAPSVNRTEELKAWSDEVVACEHTVMLAQQPGVQLASKSLAHCSDCELNSNLWLCLACGHLGCGRKNYDGSGGNNHAVDHFKQTAHGVVCKMGTITAEGSADIFCYACDETRLDTMLAEHLSHFGIELAKQSQTEKSTKELELDQNIKFAFNMTGTDGRPLPPLCGPGATGITNLGNSCYMASILQSIIPLPAFRRNFASVTVDHRTTCTAASHAQCFRCQMEKMADGLLSGRYARTAAKHSSADDDAATAEAIAQSLGGEGAAPASVAGGDGDTSQVGVRPSMFKSVAGKDHPEFSSMRQQDAFEFFQHLCARLERDAKAAGLGDAGSPASCFDFVMQQRLQCASCGGCRYSYTRENHAGVPMLVGADGRADLMTSLGLFVGEETVEFTCPGCKNKTSAVKRSRFFSTPDVLVVQVRRFVYEDWVPKKLDVEVDVPAVVELGQFIGGEPPADENVLPDDASAPPATGALLASVDALAVEQLVSMGFPQVRCEKALRATGNAGAEVAMNWILEHMDDPNIDIPDEPKAAPGATSAASQEHISALCDMGFTPAQARKALCETGGNMERAVDWLFSHSDDVGDSETSESGASDATNTIPNAGSRGGPNAYRLHAYVTHKGTSVHCGHYVAHVRMEDGRWAFFNDEKVADFGMEGAPGQGYVYFFTRTAQ